MSKILTAIWFILYSLIALFGIGIPMIVMGILALVIGILILANQ